MKVSFYVSLLLLFVTVFMMFAVYFDWIGLHIAIGPYFIHHWLSWIGSTFIAVFTPIYYWMKRNKPSSLKNLLRIHIFGNLIAFLFVSIHFTQQISRPPQFYPPLGTGVVLYPTMLLLVATGFITRFVSYKNKKALLFLHKAITLTFYLTIIIHILHGIELI
ncbi:MAG: hypothetical protein QCH99_00800 [Candidatus Bathyarchaeota archaeon]|nr:hypothetical protein [Candidatus Bathyarchaeum tardum]